MRDGLKNLQTKVRDKNSINVVKAAITIYEKKVKDDQAIMLRFLQRWAHSPEMRRKKLLKKGLFM